MSTKIELENYLSWLDGDEVWAMLSEEQRQQIAEIAKAKTTSVSELARVGGAEAAELIERALRE